MNKDKKHRPRPEKLLPKIILIILGFVFLLIGIVGVFLPVMPTVPFLLVSYFCFMKGFDRIHKWFITTKIYKDYLRPFVEFRALTLFSELTALILISISAIITMLVVSHLVLTIVFSSIFFIGYLFFLIFIVPVSKEEMNMLRNILETRDKESEQQLSLKKQAVLNLQSLLTNYANEKELLNAEVKSNVNKPGN